MPRAALRTRYSCTCARCGSQRAEVSFDEPLNTDWDGNELLLSDILGTDEDEEIIRPLEDDADRADAPRGHLPAWRSGSGR